jgi:hypothetical protein
VAETTGSGGNTEDISSIIEISGVIDCNKIVLLNGKKVILAFFPFER